MPDRGGAGEGLCFVAARLVLSFAFAFGISIRNDSLGTSARVALEGCHAAHAKTIPGDGG